MRQRLLFAAAVLFALAGCGGERSAGHYVSFADADELAGYLRWTPDRPPLVAAHRGGPLPGYPENCLAGFENALAYAPCLVECDVRRTADSVLVLMHDETLDRTSTGSGPVGERTFAEIRSLRLKDREGRVTNEIVPTLAEALEWAAGRAVLELDVKHPVSWREVIAAIRAGGAENRTVIITYNQPDAELVHRLAPDLMISASAGGVEGAERLLRGNVEPRRLLAFVGVTEPPAAVYDSLHAHGIRAILGTMGNLDRRAERRGARVYTELLASGANILATDNVPLAAEAARGFAAAPR